MANEAELRAISFRNYPAPGQNGTFETLTLSYFRTVNFGQSWGIFGIRGKFWDTFVLNRDRTKANKLSFYSFGEKKQNSSLNFLNDTKTLPLCNIEKNKLRFLVFLNKWVKWSKVRASVWYTKSKFYIAIRVLILTFLNDSVEMRLGFFFQNGTTLEPWLHLLYRNVISIACNTIEQ